MNRYKNDKFGCKSSQFYRLEKVMDDDGYKWIEVYEFHTVINGNMYYQKIVEDLDFNWRTTEEKQRIYDKDRGNKLYQKLKKDGYTFVGVYEMDVYGRKRALQK